jgi:hypothetical protein
MVLLWILIFLILLVRFRILPNNKKPLPLIANPAANMALHQIIKPFSKMQYKTKTKLMDAKRFSSVLGKQQNPL